MAKDITKKFKVYIKNLHTIESSMKKLSFFPTDLMTVNGLDYVKNIELEFTDLTDTNIELIEIRDSNFYNVAFSDTSFGSCEFSNCEFLECDFAFSDFWDCSFINCNFISTQITIANFNSCFFKNVKIESSRDISITKFDGCTFQKFAIEKTELSGVYFDSLKSDKRFQSIIIKDSSLNNIHFTNVDFKKASISKCILTKNVFTNCIIPDNNIIEECSNDNSINHIDLQTILLSSIDNEQVLSLFGLKHSFTKDYIKELTGKVKFQSVFISYSFKDSDFARHLNEKLRSKGVNTFLWEHDAPGGKRLKKIMQEYIQKYDRVLFIASENSLKSEACHFELKESRERQNKEWKDIYYPIHIDDYLFKLCKDDIPKTYRDEFWANIEEIKEFHSVDFSPFKNDYKNNKKYEAKVSALAKDLLL